ncbi:MAG: proprotein convertase P-domain-containing protein, partial [Cryomorphaceae bacterium]
NGSTSVIVPNATTTEARIMVMNAKGTFFDISNFDFTIAGLSNGFLIVANDTTQSACVGESLVYEISIQGVGGFDEMISLSLEGDIGDVDAILGDNTLMVGESTTLTIDNTVDLDAGILNIAINGSAPSFQQSLNIEAGFNSIIPEVPTLLSPVDGAEFLPTDLILDWESSESPDALYTIEISTDENFTSDVQTLFVSVESQVNVPNLSPATLYYWRVMKETSCSVGDFSEVYSFGTHSCFDFASADVPVNISAIAGEYTSTLEIPFEGIIQDLNVVNIEGVHGNTGQLIMSLISPSGEEVVLFDGICSSTSDFDLGFDDSSVLEEVDCPATDGAIYKPNEALEIFIGENTAGTWTLSITDVVSGGGGALNNWSIEVCVANEGSFVLTADEESSQVCQGESTTFSLSAEEVFAFENPITLSAENVPAGMTISFDPATISTGQSSEVTIFTEADFNADIYSPVIVGTSTGFTDDFEKTVEVNLVVPEAIDLASPSEGVEISTLGFFEWGASSSPSAVYTLEISSDDLFSTIIESIGPLSETTATVANLPPSEFLFWRVNSDNGCVSSNSLTRSFSTLSCSDLSASDGLPLVISSVAGVYSSELVIEQSGAIESITIPNIEGNHFSVNDLIVSLESPSGTEVILFSDICDGDQNFDLGFLEGANSEVDCPPTTGELFAPEESFTAFQGEDAAGTWTLSVTDIQNGGGGQLNSWSLLICYEEDVVSTDNAGAPDFSIFPNPTNDIITVISEEDRIDELVMYDISGRMLEQIQVNGNTITFDLSEYSKGAYLIRLRGSFGTATEKILKK